MDPPRLISHANSAVIRLALLKSRVADEDALIQVKVGRFRSRQFGSHCTHADMVMARAGTSTIDCGGVENCPLSPGCTPQAAQPCLSVERIHAEKLAFCDALETLADSLPARVDRLECLRIAAELVPVMRASHDFEERHIFPLFTDLGREPARISSVSRLKAEHIADECAAADLSEELLRIGHGGRIDNPEALGFMLRALFQTMRRHIAFEREHIFPAIREAGKPQ